MKTLLVVNASGRITRSITRHLTRRFAEQWMSLHSEAQVIHRDVGTQPPPPIDEAWIAAGFTGEEQRTEEMRAALALSETLIEEILRSDAIVMGVPMYNFGMPAQMKAYIDQIIRVNRTFQYTMDENNPYLPLIPARPLALVTATGTGGYEPGGPSEHLNFLDPHLKAVLGFIGLGDIKQIRVGFEERKDNQFKRSMHDAESAIDETVKLFARMETATATA